MSKTVYKSKAPKKISAFFIVLLIIEAILVGLCSYAFRYADGTPHIGDYNFFLTKEDDVNYNIRKDTLIVSENTIPGKDKINHAILCRNVPGKGTAVLWLKDIRSAGEQVDGVNYIAFLDKNSDEEYSLKEENIVGIVKTSFPQTGKIIRFVTQPKGIAIAFAIPAAVWILLEIIAMMIVNSKKKHILANTDPDTEYLPETTIDDVLESKDDATPIEQDIEKLRNSSQLTEDADDAEMTGENTDAEEQAEEDTYEYAEEISEPADNEETDNAEEPAEEQQPPKKVDVDETVSNTRKASSESLEDLIKMMEEEQKKLNERLKK
ncbi:MAG: hypothetical protein ACI4RN_06655 [Oscillospiraceae bacterium]